MTLEGQSRGDNVCVCVCVCVRVLHVLFAHNTYRTADLCLPAGTATGNSQKNSILFLAVKQRASKREWRQDVTQKTNVNSAQAVSAPHNNYASLQMN